MDCRSYGNILRDLAGDVDKAKIGTRKWQKLCNEINVLAYKMYNDPTYGPSPEAKNANITSKTKE